MTSENEIKTDIRYLFNTQNLAVLATQSRGEPYASLVAFVGGDDLKDILFATPKTTRKYANLKNAPRVALLIDSGENKISDFHRATAVTATGTARDVSENERDQFERLYLAKHPHLKDFLEAPTTVLIRVEVDCYYLVKNFQKVMKLHVNR